MKMRKDSAFAKLTEDQIDVLVDGSKSLGLSELVEMLKTAKEPIHCSMTALRKFLNRVEKERRLENLEEDADLIESLSKRSETPKVREATLQALRERMFDGAFKTDDREGLAEMFQMLNTEKEKERAAALEERKVRVAEENAKIGWRKLESENARTGLRTLPRIRELLMDATKSTDERVSGALQLLMKMDEQLLLPEAKGVEQHSAPTKREELSLGRT